MDDSRGPDWLIRAIDDIRTKLHEHVGGRPDCRLCRVADHINYAFGEAIGEPVEVTGDLRELG
jgi:hypothetical protein